MAPRPVLLGDVCQGLKVRASAAPAWPLLPLVGEPHDAAAPTDQAARDAQMVALRDAVLQLMNDASQEAQLRWEVLLNVMLALLTEVFHALLEIGVWEREEFDTFLDGAFQDDLRQFIESEQRVDVHRGLSMNAIAKQLTSERVPTQRDRRARGPARKLGAGTWHPSSLFALLTNRTYTGVQYYGKTENATSPTNPDKKTRHRMKQTEDWLAIAVPPLIDQDTFEAAQTRMQHNARMSRRNRKHEYLLCNARLRCGQCGSSMSGQRNTTNALRYYRCSGAPYHNATRCRKVANARAIETEVWSAVEAALQDPEIIAREVHRRLEHADREQDTVTRERECFTRQLGQCEKELQKWEAAYVAEVITLDDFRTKKADVAGRRASLEREIARLEAEQQLLRQVELETTSLIEYCQRVRGNLCQFSTAEQHVALDVLNIAVIWHPEKPLEIRGSIPIGIASNTP